jgi:hypothetical protein
VSVLDGVAEGLLKNAIERDRRRFGNKREIALMLETDIDAVLARKPAAKCAGSEQKNKAQVGVAELIGSVAYIEGKALGLTAEPMESGLQLLRAGGLRAEPVKLDAEERQALAEIVQVAGYAMALFFLGLMTRAIKRWRSSCIFSSLAVRSRTR